MPVLVSRNQPLLLREDPYLKQPQRLFLRVVELAVHHPSSGGHVLHVTGLQHRPVSHIVAVLELAFRGLGAERAVSGWLEGNIASARVSAKLGYRESGLGEATPRGVPVVEHRVEREREGWQSPVPVEISGLAAA